jgi:hypothetical protein
MTPSSYAQLSIPGPLLLPTGCGPLWPGHMLQGDIGGEGCTWFNRDGRLASGPSRQPIVFLAPSVQEPPWGGCCTCGFSSDLGEEVR